MLLMSSNLRGYDVQVVADYTDTMGYAEVILIDANHYLLMGGNISNRE